MVEQIEPISTNTWCASGCRARAARKNWKKLVAQLASQALDHSRPLWQFHLIENYAGGTALVSRIHHCIADGIALMGVLLSMTSPDPAQDDGGAAAEAREPAKHGTAWEPWITPFTETAIKAIVRTGDLATRALKAYGRVLEDPEIAGKAAAGYAQSAAQV